MQSLKIWSCNAWLACSDRTPLIYTYLPILITATNLSSERLQHLVNLRKEFLTYFSEISDIDLELVRKPFDIPIGKVTDDYRMSSLTSETTLLVKTCLRLYRSATFGQGYVFLTHVSVKNASKCCCLSALGIYVKQGFPRWCR